MVFELTAVILNQVVSGRKSVLDAYGEVVFKAWRAATGACLECIETHLIQNVGCAQQTFQLNAVHRSSICLHKPCAMHVCMPAYPE